MAASARHSVLGGLGLLAALTTCLSCAPDVQVDLSASVECGPAGGVEIRAEVRAEPPTDLLLEVVSEGQVLARTHARAGSVRRKLPPLTPVFSRDASWRALSHAVARAREATSERLLAETKVEQRDQLCH
jgi:hypothetical protein